MSLRVTKSAYFSLLKHTEQLLLVTFNDPTAEWEGTAWTDADAGGRCKNGQMWTVSMIKYRLQLEDFRISTRDIIKNYKKSNFCKFLINKTL